MPHSFVAVFCEDIREETAGTHSLVGVMPDNINLQANGPSEAGMSLMFPKMGIYLRINLDRSIPPTSPVAARLTIPGAPALALGEIGMELIERAYAEGAENNLPVVGLIFKTVLSPVQLREPGVITVHASIDGHEHICGALNLIISAS
jgi:hypothetical protein